MSTYQQLRRDAETLLDKTVSMEVPPIGRSDQPPIIVLCRVLDTRLAFGRLDVLVTPLMGDRTMWVQASRVQPLDEMTPEL